MSSFWLLNFEKDFEEQTCLLCNVSFKCILISDLLFFMSTFDFFWVKLKESLKISNTGYCADFEFTMFVNISNKRFIIRLFFW